MQSGDAANVQRAPFDTRKHLRKLRPKERPPEGGLSNS
jgi:hypothetical protein